MTIKPEITAAIISSLKLKPPSSSPFSSQGGAVGQTKSSVYVDGDKSKQDSGKYTTGRCKRVCYGVRPAQSRDSTISDFAEKFSDGVGRV